MLANDMKKGQLIKMRCGCLDGWLDVIADDGKGIERQVEKMGAIFIWDIAVYWDGFYNAWLTLELSDSQKAARDDEERRHMKALRKARLINE
jgi:hypothetical protein